MAVTGGIALASTVGSAIIGNQQKQKAKGQAGKVMADAQAAQDAADAKLRQQHFQNLEAQSQAALVARNAIAQPLARPASLTAPNASPPASAATTPLPAPLAPVQRKTLLGQ